MFNIDLLKGRNLPDKFKWREMAVVCVAMTVLIMFTIVVSRNYFINKKTMVKQGQVISAYDLMLKKVQGDKAKADSIVSEGQSIQASFVEVNSALRRQVQWSGMLLAINNSLQDGLTVNKLNVKVRKVRKVVSQKRNPDKKVNISVPARTLTLSLFSDANTNGDAAIQQFQKKLIKTESFKKNVREIVIALREPDNVNDMEVVRYELNCILKIREP